MSVFTHAENNTPFIVSLAADSYIMYVTYGSVTAGYCFPVTACACPVLPTGVITRSGIPPAVVYFMELTFDMSGGFPTCAFQVSWDDGVITNFVTISSLADFTSNVGSNYKLKIHLYSDHVAYIISTIDGIGCTSGAVNLVYSCHAPAPPTVSLLHFSGAWYIQVHYASCGATCHDFFINYNQNYVIPGNSPDAGGVAVTVDCGMVPYDGTYLLSPSPTFYTSVLTGPGVAYDVYIADCCGTNYYFNLRS